MKLKYQIKIAKELKLLIYVLVTCLIGAMIAYRIGAVYEKEQYEQFLKEQAIAKAEYHKRCIDKCERLHLEDVRYYEWYWEQFGEDGIPERVSDFGTYKKFLPDRYSFIRTQSPYESAWIVAMNLFSLFVLIRFVILIYKAIKWVFRTSKIEENSNL